MTTPTLEVLNVDCFDPMLANAAQIESEAKALIRHYLGPDWDFRWSTRKRAWGHCDHRVRIIYIAKMMTTCTRGEARQTILHEIAHGLTFGHNHDGVWKAMARRLGHPNPTSTSDHSGTGPAYNWELVCGRCGAALIRRYRRSDMRGRIHRGCGGELVWEAL